MKSAMVSGGSTGGAENRPGTGAAMPCPAPGKRFTDRGTSQGRLEQQLPTDPCVPPAPPGQGKRRVGLACSGGDAWGSLQTVGFHLISSHLISSHLISSHLISSHLISSHLISSHLISFCCSPQALGERHQPLSPFLCVSDHPHPAICKGAANMAMDPVSTVLLALQSQPEVRLSWEKRLPFWLKMDPQAQSPGVLHMGEHPERAEQTQSFLASPTARRTSHPSAHPGCPLV